MWRLTKKVRSSASKSRNQLRFVPQIEGMESRVVPYAVSGNAWPNPQLITISFMPDGTTIGANTSNLFSTFNTKFGSATTWQNQILKAAQQWAQQTNINFAVVSDNGEPEGYSSSSGTGACEQGDPGYGDIRIGGYNFGSSTLANTYLPPSINNYSVAGDIQFNTGQTYNIGSTYDLFTVAVHEFGHALGLLHSQYSNADMWGTYSGTKTGLVSDDISGIRNIYSSNNPRSTDAFGGANNTIANAANVSSDIDPNLYTALVSGLDIASAGQKEYFTATAPATTGSTVTISVQSQGLSLLAPSLTVYASDGVTVLGSASGYGHYGTTVTLNLTNKIAANAQFYVKVAGADNTALGTGDYALTMSFAGNALPIVPLPNTQVLNGSPLSAGGGQSLIAHTDDGVDFISRGPAVNQAYIGSFPAVTAHPVTISAVSTTTVNSQIIVRSELLAEQFPDAHVAGSTSAVPHVRSEAIGFELNGVSARVGSESAMAPMTLTTDGQEAVLETGGGANLDLAARCDACFLSGSSHDAVNSDSLNMATDPAAQAAALAVIFGSGWTSSMQRMDRNRRAVAFARN